jgi:type II secretory pathway pseudopilin PulG
MKRIVMMLTVALVMAAMMVAMALPALAAKPAPTKEECLAVQAALNQRAQLTGQQKQLIREFPNLGQCIAASEG